MNMAQQMREAPMNEEYKRALTESALAGAAQTRAQTGQLGEKLGLDKQQVDIQRGQLGVQQRSVAVHEAAQQLQAQEFAEQQKMNVAINEGREADALVNMEQAKLLRQKRSALESMNNVLVEIAPGNVISLGQMETVSPGFAAAFIRTQAAGLDEKGALTATALKGRMDQLMGRYSKNIGGSIFGGYEEMKKQAAAGKEDAQVALQEYQDLDTQYNALIASGRQKVKAGAAGVSTTGKEKVPPAGWKPMWKEGVGTFYLSPDGKQAWVNGKLVQ